MAAFVPYSCHHAALRIDGVSHHSVFVQSRELMETERRPRRRFWLSEEVLQLFNCFFNIHDRAVEVPPTQKSRSKGIIKSKV